MTLAEALSAIQRSYPRYTVTAIRLLSEHLQAYEVQFNNHKAWHTFRLTDKPPAPAQLELI